ncbi:MAG: hypothetical protein AAB588_01395 [Patescibacteria group bacterium]
MSSLERNLGRREVKKRRITENVYEQELRCLRFKAAVLALLTLIGSPTLAIPGVRDYGYGSLPKPSRTAPQNTPLNHVPEAKSSQSPPPSECTPEWPCIMALPEDRRLDHEHYIQPGTSSIRAEIANFLNSL